MDAITLKETKNKIQEIVDLLGNQSNGQPEAVTSNNKASALNLVHYMAMRKLDLSEVQKKLGRLGLSRFARAEGNIMHSLYRSLYNLSKLLDEPNANANKHHLSAMDAQATLHKNTEKLLGKKTVEKRVRIMVTLPSEAAHNQALIDQFVLAGMNCARINCAHDNEALWAKMIENVHKSSTKLNKDIKISMDLSGPKIRTGEITDGPRILKLSPKKDAYGHIVEPAYANLVDNLPGTPDGNTISVPGPWLNKLDINEAIYLYDTRNKKRKLIVSSRGKDEVQVRCDKTTYFGQGTALWSENPEIGESFIQEIHPLESYIYLQTGDELEVMKEGIGQGATYSEDGSIQNIAKIACTLPDIVDQVLPGEKIYFDDGKIEGTIKELRESSFIVTITKTNPNGSKLKADKGINLPDSKLKISGLTAKDKVDLKFICKHADMVNFSFVNTIEDIEDLHRTIDSFGGQNLGIILKIETKKAFNNLPNLLLKSMERDNNLGIMIARGDLAIEAGWQNIGQVQNEILKICTAAHVPVIWATQVLESLAKKGIPSRSEMTDITQSVQAECVMLNKGPFIVESLQLLAHVLEKEEQYQNKNEAMLPSMATLK